MKTTVHVNSEPRNCQVIQNESQAKLVDFCKIRFGENDSPDNVILTNAPQQKTSCKQKGMLTPHMGKSKHQSKAYGGRDKPKLQAAFNAIVCLDVNRLKS